MEGWLICDHGSLVNCSDNGEVIETIGGCCSPQFNDEMKKVDFDEKLRSLFDQVLMILLRGVNGKKGNRPIPPSLGNDREIDLFKLFCLVRERGGFRAVSEDKLWGLIAEKFGFDCTFCGSLKLIYFKYLDDLDQWLSRVTRDKCLENGRNGFGGNLGLLSLELEKGLRNFSIDERENTNNDNDKIFKCVDVPIEETLDLIDANEGTEVHNVVVKFGVKKEDRLCDIKKGDGKAVVIARLEEGSFRKRKRDVVGGMLSWINKVAKDPCNPSLGKVPGCSRWEENKNKDFWSIALMVREARLQKRYVEPSVKQSRSHQKKPKMHPSMYEDDHPNRHLIGGLRFSERLSSFENTPTQCCNSCSTEKCTFNNPLTFLPENGLNKVKHVNPGLLDTKFIPSANRPIEKRILVGPKFQAVVPVWTGVVNESDPKWLGTRIWAPDSKDENPGYEVKRLKDSCECPLHGSVECHRLHIAENRAHLRSELGRAFFQWEFDTMGEEVSLTWLPEEEKTFKQTIKSDNPFSEKSFFPNRTRKELVSYYFNVHLINHRSYQNRVVPKEVDSDNDEVTFGSVSDTFGSKAVKIRGLEPSECKLNQQVSDFDY